MDTKAWGIRLRSILDRNVALVALAVVLLAAVGGYVTYTAYAQETTRTETVRTAAWESSAGFTHSATVVNDTDVYERGETLRDRTTYFRAITPELDGTFRYTYTAPDGDVQAKASAVLVLRSAARTEGENVTEYWRVESALGQKAGSLSPGDTLRVPFSTNVSAAAERLQRLDEQVGGTPGEKQLFVEVRLDLSGTRAGRPVDTTRTYRLPITLSGNVYEVQDPGTVTHSGTLTEQRTVVVEPGPLRAYGGPLLLVIAIVADVGLLACRYTGYLSIAEQEREWLAYRNAREEFDDWITVARVPGVDQPTIEVETLDGLVDVAIDTDRRVLEDRDSERFLVLEDDRTYVYRPPVFGGERGPLGTDEAAVRDVDSTGERADDPLEAEAASDGTGTESPPVVDIEGIDTTCAERLASIGIETATDLAAADAETVAEAADTSPSRAADWIERARNGT